MDVDGWVADTAWIQLARVVRLLAAALLLGVALLLMVVLGQGIAAAGEQATAPGDTADGDSPPAAETTGDGPAAGPDALGTSDGVYHDFPEAVTAANAVLAQSVTPLPQDTQPPDPQDPEPITRQPESWGEGYRPKQPQAARQEPVEEDGGAQPDAQRDGTLGRGVDIMLAPNEVYLTIGGTDTPGAPYAHTIPARPADTAAATPQPTGTNPPGELTTGLAYDLNELSHAPASIGPLDQYPQDDHGVVQLPAVTVTAKPVTVPDGTRTATVAASTTPEGSQADTSGPA